MTFTADQIKKFQELYRKHFGESITNEEAVEKGAQLVNLVSAVYRPKINGKQGKI